MFLSLKGDKERLSGGPGSGCGGAAVVVVVERRRRALASDFLISWSLLLLCFCAGFRSKEGGGGDADSSIRKIRHPLYVDVLCLWRALASFSERASECTRRSSSFLGSLEGKHGERQEIVLLFFWNTWTAGVFCYTLRCCRRRALQRSVSLRRYLISRSLRFDLSLLTRSGNTEWRLL